MKEKPDFLPFEDLRSEVYLYGAHISAMHGTAAVCQRHLHHMMFEINLVLEGSQTILINGQSQLQHAGELILIPPMTLHQYRIDREELTRFFVAHIKITDSSFLQKIAKAAPLIIGQNNNVNLELAPRVKTLMELLKTKQSSVSILHTVMDIVYCIEKFCEDISGADSYDLELSYYIAREIEKLLVPSGDDEEQLEQNWFENIAARLGFSRRHCGRVFSEAYSMSPRDYLSVLRQQEAMQMLLLSNDSVEHIAHRVGFGNVQSFIRQFTKWTGTTPGAFRKTQQNAMMYLIPLEEK